MKGIWRRIDDKTIEITELPVGKWTGQFKVPPKSCTASSFGQEQLEKMMESPEKTAKSKDAKDSAPIVSDYKDYNTESRVHFEVTVPDLSKMTDSEVLSLALTWR